MLKKLIALATVAIISGCGSDSSSDTPPSSSQSSLNFSVINLLDSPQSRSEVVSFDQQENCHHGKCVSDLSKVNIAFNYVFLKKVASLPDEESTCDQTGQCEQYHEYFDDEPNQLRMIEVKEANGGDASALFDGMMVKPGYYQMCLYMNGKHEQGAQVETEFDSHVIENDGTIDYLSTPSQGSCAGAKPPQDARPWGRLVSKTFEVKRGENNLAFWFDLDNTLQYNRKHAWRFLGEKDFEIVHVERNFGDILGTIDMDAVQQQCTSNNYESLEAVYLYPQGTAQEQMLGYYSLETGTDGEHRPLRQAQVAIPFAEDSVGSIAYFSFSELNAGEYSLGYSCTTQHDNQDEQGAGFEIFRSLSPVTVLKGQTTYPEFNE
ncbi:hypothetical protein [uncultured Vibrio sp.]|uniref:hypothetical protein n=1 Tax=uncultured Vibrio sp. TaxID=114054 RepID=UPI0025DA93E7|nr:hypothetical protein [uncultured Vibrio sp.]